jgi:hypothetical protein
VVEYSSGGGQAGFHAGLHSQNAQATLCTYPQRKKENQIQYQKGNKTHVESLRPIGEQIFCERWLSFPSGSAWWRDLRYISLDAVIQTLRAYMLHAWVLPASLLYGKRERERLPRPRQRRFHLE